MNDHPLKDPAWCRAWVIGYALTYHHDPRPLMYACAGYNRFELDRDGPEIPHMARYIAKVDAAYAASRLLPPWDQARAILRAEYAAFMERCPADRVEYRRALRRHLRQCDAMEAAERASGRIRRRRVTDATITKWWFHAAEGKR